MSNIGGLTPIGKHIKEFPRTEALFEDISNEDVAQVIHAWQESPVAAAIDVFGFKYGLPGHQTIAMKLAWTVGDCIQIWSRGSGKSASKSSYINTLQTGLVKIESILPASIFRQFSVDFWHELQEPLDLWNGEGWQKVDKILIQPQKRTKTVRTLRGYEITGSDVHLVQCLEEGEIVWRSFSDIQPGDRVLIGRNQEINWGDHEVDLDECYLIGLLIGDGSMRKSLTLTSADQEILDHAAKYESSIAKQNKGSTCKYDVSFSSKFYRYLINKYRFDQVASYYKTIPQSILTSKPALRACLQGLFDTDGGCDSKGLSFCTTSYSLARQVHIALSLFGIISKVREKKTKSKFGKAYVIVLCGAEACKFADRIGFRLTRKQNKLQEWCKDRNYNSNIDAIPCAKDILVRLKSKYRFPFDGSNKEWRKHRGGIKNRNHLTASSPRFSMDLLPVEAKADKDYRKLENLIKLNEKYFFDEVKHVEDGIDDCVDFNVPTGEKYWSNGFINHNTFFLSMFAWLSAVLFPEEKIGIFGPSFRQSKFVWAEIERIYEKSPVLRELCIKRPTMSPDRCHTKLYNGSIIDALPLGDGSKIRGARYYRILCDEAAQIPEDILDIVIQGMRATTKDPMEAVYRMKLQRELVKEGRITQDEAVYKPQKNKMLMASTAFYQFNHLYRRVDYFRRDIMDPVNENLNPVVKVPDMVMWNDQRALIMFDYKDPPEGFMNIDSIMEAKKKMSELKWKMEYCFAPGTQIITSKGIKPIESVNKGDLVLTHQGKFKPVTNTMSRNINEEVVEIKQYGCTDPIIVTSDHPFYVSEDEWQQASHMESLKLANVRQLSGISDIDLFESYDFFQLCKIGNDEYVRHTFHPERRNSVASFKKLSRSHIFRNIKLGFDLGYIYGLLFTSSNYFPNNLQKGTNFLINHPLRSLNEKVANKLKNSFIGAFRYKPVQDVTAKSSESIQIRNTGISLVIQDACESTEYGKILRHDILFSNPTFMRGFLCGFWDSDTSIARDDKYIAASCNKNLLLHVKLCMGYFGIASSMIEYVPEIFEGSCLEETPYVLEVLDKDASKLTAILKSESFEVNDDVPDSNYVKNDGLASEFKIYERRIRDYSGTVYNLEVDGDQSYSLTGATCHNCAYFPPDSEGFFRISKIEAARAHKQFTVEPKGKLQYNYVMGIDVARNSDNFAIAIGRIMGDKVELVNILTLNSREFPVMHDTIRECLDNYKVIYMCMDTGGGGTSLEDLLHDERMCPGHQKLIWDSVSNDNFKGKTGWHILEMIKFSDDSIPKMAYQLQADIDHGRFLFPSQPSTIPKIASSGFDENGIPLDKLEDIYDEIEQCIDETTSIMAQSTRTGKIHLGLPGEVSKAHATYESSLMAPPRKDRWTAIMLMNWAMHRKLRQTKSAKKEKPELATGMSMFSGMNGNSRVPTHIAMRMAKKGSRR